jgi:hypothetical protein
VVLLDLLPAPHILEVVVVMESQAASEHLQHMAAVFEDMNDKD